MVTDFRRLVALGCMFLQNTQQIVQPNLKVLGLRLEITIGENLHKHSRTKVNIRRVSQVSDSDTY